MTSPYLHDESPGGPAEEARSFDELRGTGLLWLINRVVMHPRGYALAIHHDEDGRAIGWTLLGDDTEPWSFSPAEDEREKALFDKLKELLP